MIFSALAIVSLFSQIFVASLFVGAALTFFRLFVSGRDPKFWKLALFFLAQGVVVALITVSTLSYNLGMFSTALELFSKVIYGTILLTTFIGLIFLGERFGISRGLVFRSFLAVGGGALFLLSAALFRSTGQLAFPEGMTEPVPRFLEAQWIQWVWLAFLFLLVLFYVVNSIRAESPGERSLSGYGALGALLVIGGWVVRGLYQSSILRGPQGLNLLAWALVLLGVGLWFLSEGLPARSIHATHPWQFLRSRVLFKLIFLFVLLLVILPESAMIGAVYLNQRAISSEVHKSYLERSESLADDMEAHFQQVVRATGRAGRVGDLAPASRSLIYRELFKEFPDIRAVGKVDSSGAVSYMHGSGSDGETPAWVRARFRAPRDHPVVPRVDPSTGKADFLLLVPAGSGQFWVARLSTDYAEAKILKTLVGRKGLGMLMDRDGRVVVHPDPKLRSKIAFGKIPVLEAGVEEGGIVAEYTGQSNVRYVGAGTPIKSLGWVAVVQEPLAVAYADIQQIVNSNILLVVISTLVTVLAGILFAKSIEYPIREVIRGTEEVRKGNLAHVIPVHTQDEIGELAAAFNQMTRELRDSQEHLIASEKLAALGTMAAGMAHEIKNPLVSLRTFTQLLQQKFQDPEFREKFSSIVPQEIEKINRIAENLLKFGRPSKPELKKVNINEILEDVLALFENECRKHDVRVTIKLAKVPEITGDPGQLSQAFINIILNAIQALEKGGELTVKTDVGEVIRLGAVSAGAARAGQGSGREMVWGVVERGAQEFPPAHHTPVVFVEVTDTGPGISEESLKNIFDPFYTTKAKGTGMGLPITLRIIEEHKGSIKVKSAAGKGTTFIITLPQRLEEKKTEA